MGSYNYYYGKYYNSINKKSRFKPINYTYLKTYRNSFHMDTLCKRIISKLIKQIGSIIFLFIIVIFLKSSSMPWSRNLYNKFNNFMKGDVNINYLIENFKNIKLEDVKDKVVEKGKDIIININDGSFEKGITNKIDDFLKLFS